MDNKCLVNQPLRYNSKVTAHRFIMYDDLETNYLNLFKYHIISDEAASSEHRRSKRMKVSKPEDPVCSSTLMYKGKCIICLENAILDELHPGELY